MNGWSAVLVGSAACYALKLGGLSIPRRVLRNPRLQTTAEMLPIALLSALVAIEAFTTGHRLALDARVAGLSVAAVAVLLRAPFLVVVFAAALATALVRLQLR